MGAVAPPPLLVVQHVPWEGPHRVLDAFPDAPVPHVDVLGGAPLPPVSDVAGAVFTGPMSVSDIDALSAAIGCGADRLPGRSRRRPRVGVAVPR